MEAPQALPASEGAVPPKAKRIFPGKVIRVSQKVYDTLKRHLREKDSWDSMLRRLHGIPDRRRKEPRAREFWMLPGALQVFETESKARGAAVVNGVKRGLRKAEAPIRVREIL